MKIVLMVAAGMAVGLTVALAVLVQIVASLLQALERLAPLLVVAALLVVALHLFRRRSRSQVVQPDQRHPLPTLPLAAAPMPVPVPVAPRAIVEQQGPYLRWGPVQDDLAPPPAVYGTAAQLRRSPARPLPSRPTGDSRP